MLTGEGGRIETTIGYVYWNLYFDDGSYVEIYALHIAPEYRCRGCARAILESAIAIIKKQYPGKEIRIIAQPNEDGIDFERLSKFYASLGLKLWKGK